MTQFDAAIADGRCHASLSETEMHPSDHSGENRSSPAQSMIRALFSALDLQGVRYCHWKSNIRLADAMSGSDDVDLLVAREDAALFQSTLLSHGFKLARSRGGIDHPGVFHAIGLDEAEADMVHVHAYTQIVTGDSLVKNYRFPVESNVLSETREIGGVHVPSADVELALFVVRIALKHGSLVELLMVNRNYGVVIEELAWLRAAANEARSAALCAEMFPTIQPSLFRKAIEAIGPDGTLFDRMAVGQRMAWCLRSRRRLGLFKTSASRLWRVAVLLRGRFIRRNDLTLQSGGAIIAFVGPKATGKSTLTRALAERLGKHLDVENIHAGKPPATMLSILPRIMIPLAHRLFRKERPGEYEKPERRQEKAYSLIYVLRMVLAAHDRRKLLTRAHREATAGRIVISDRYPSDTPGAIDSSAFDEEAIDRCDSPLKRWLMRLEQAQYRSLPRPDLVVRLMAPLDVTITRDQRRFKEGGADADALRRRWDLETKAYLGGDRVVHIDTSQPLDDTIRNILTAVWRRL